MNCCRSRKKHKSLGGDRCVRCTLTVKRRKERFGARNSAKNGRVGSRRNTATTTKPAPTLASAADKEKASARLAFSVWWRKVYTKQLAIGANRYWRELLRTVASTVNHFPCNPTATSLNEANAASKWSMISCCKTSGGGRSSRLSRLSSLSQNMSRLALSRAISSS